MRVVVTGLGAVSSIGLGAEAFWSAAMTGRSGVTALEPLGGFPLEAYRCRIAGQVHGFDPAAHLHPGVARKVDRYAQFALVASAQAIDDAGLDVAATAERVGVYAGAGMGGMIFGERAYDKLHADQRPDRVHPRFVPAITLNSAAGIVGITTGARGPNITVSTACSSSAHALGQALLALRGGLADAVVVVGAEASITPLVFAGFCSLRTMSSSFEHAPEEASRPFDVDRDGFVMGEGAAALILETEAHASARGAAPRAELAGYAATGEAHHMVIPKPDGLGMARTMRLALAHAGVATDAVGYVNAHATSTPAGDAVEARAIREVFGSRADEVLVSATKALIGHTLGAAGAFGALACVRTLQTGDVHPTVNLTDPGDCALGGLSARAQRGEVDVAVLNAFGFGSNNASLVFRRAR